MKRVLVILGCTLVILMCITVVYAFIKMENHIRRREELSREATTPLPSDTIDDLCNKFEITDDTLCDHETDVYAPDFYDSIEMTMVHGMTFDEIEEMLGEYRFTECSILSSENFYEEICSYDLRGDHVFHFAIIFDENRRVLDTSFSNISWQYSE